jgi:dTMP kinase
MPPHGLFVTFEGGEHSGKSTQLAAVAERARAQGSDVITCREPGGTPLGERLREALFSLEGAPSPLTELLIFAAARAELVHAVIRPALERGALVLCDRFADSTVAYQGYGRGIDLATIAAVNAAATGGLAPNLTVLLDLPVANARRRVAEGDYLERENLAFHDRVREGFLALAAAEPARWLIVDGSLTVEQVTDAIWERLGASLPSL